MYSIDMVAEFCTPIIEVPVKEDPEKATAGAERKAAAMTRTLIF